MADCNCLIVSLSWRLLRSICWLPWRMTCLLICRFYLMFIFMSTMISRLFGISLCLIFLAIIFTLISLCSLLVNSRSASMLIRDSLGTLFLSLGRWVCISMVLIRTVIVLLSMFLMLSWRFSIWSIVLMTVGRRILLCVHFRIFKFTVC